MGQGARRRRARGARPRPAEGARGERARTDADLCVRAGGSDLDLAGWRGRVRAGAPRRLGCRRCLRHVSQQDRGRGQSDRYRGDRGPHHCLRGSRLGTDARPRAAGRHRRVFHHPDARRELSPVRRDRAVAVRDRRNAAGCRGGARSGDDHSADRRSDRAPQPALLSEPAR